MVYLWTCLNNEELYRLNEQRPDLFAATEWFMKKEDEEDDDFPEPTQELSPNFSTHSTTSQEVLQLRQPNRVYSVFLEYRDLDLSRLSITVFDDEISFQFSEEEDYLVKNAAQFNRILRSQGLTYQNCLDAKLEGTLRDTPEEELTQKINVLINSIVNPSQPKKERLYHRLLRSFGLRQ